MSTSEIRKISNRKSFRNELLEEKEKICVNCGTTEDVEWHHIVAIADGGTNNFGNIVPLCHRCHQLAHGAINIRSIHKAKVTGRKRKMPDNYKSTIDTYLQGIIGTKECKKLLGMTEVQKLRDKKWFIEYLSERNIVEYKNKVDLFACKKNGYADHTGRIVAYIKFSDGKEYIKTIE